MSSKDVYRELKPGVADLRGKTLAPKLLPYGPAQLQPLLGPVRPDEAGDL